MGVDDTQYGLLSQLAEKTNTTGTTAEQPSSEGFLSSLGDKLKASGIDGGSLLKGLVSIAAPLIISKMMNKNTTATNETASTGGGLLGGGGLGSLFNLLSGGKGLSGATSLIGKLFG